MSSCKKETKSFAMDGDIISPRNIANVTQSQKPSRIEQLKNIKASEVASKRTIETIGKSITPNKR